MAKRSAEGRPDSRILEELERVLVERQEYTLNRMEIDGESAGEAARAQARVRDALLAELLDELREIAAPHGSPTEANSAQGAAASMQPPERLIKF